MILKTNKNDCYFYCNITGAKSEKFIESPNLSLYYDNGKKLDNIYLDPRTNNIVGRDEEENIYIIDDGYRNKMIKAGYIVYKNYDQEKILDKEIGTKIHDELLLNVSEAIMKEYPECTGIVNGYSEKYIIEKSGYRFTIGVYSNIDIVKKNQQRKINGLQFYPFDKKMDNYGTLYITIHSLRMEETTANNFNIADTILESIIKNTQDTKFTTMDIVSSLYFIETEGEN